MGGAPGHEEQRVQGPPAEAQAGHAEQQDQREPDREAVHAHLVRGHVGEPLPARHGLAALEGPLRKELALHGQRVVELHGGHRLLRPAFPAGIPLVVLDVERHRQPESQPHQDRHRTPTGGLANAGLAEVEHLQGVAHEGHQRLARIADQNERDELHHQQRGSPQRIRPEHPPENRAGEDVALQMEHPRLANNPRHHHVEDHQDHRVEQAELPVDARQAHLHDERQHEAQEHPATPDGRGVGLAIPLADAEGRLEDL